MRGVLTIASGLFGRKTVEDDPHQTAYGDCYPEGAELLRIINETIFYDRPDLQYRFDASAPPLITLPRSAASLAEPTPEGARPVAHPDSPLGSVFTGDESPAAGTSALLRIGAHPLRTSSVASPSQHEDDI